MKIPLTKPYLPPGTKKAVMSVLDSGFITEGQVTKKFEKEIENFIGCKYALAVTSCTTGLELALRALNIGKGDEVIVPDYTYPATGAVPNIIGATTVIVDINMKTMLIDYNEIENAINDNTKAIIPVSLFGNPLDYERLNKIKEKHKVHIIEDSACSFGAEYNNKKVGTFADISVFSLHPRKFLTTGEGGIITTNNYDLFSWMNSYKHFGINLDSSSNKDIEFCQIGTNYKISDILTSIGLEQLKVIEDLHEKRKESVKIYIELIENKLNDECDNIRKCITIPSVTDKGDHSYQTFIILIPERNKILNDLRSKGIEVQIGSYSLHHHKAFNMNPCVKRSKSLYNSDLVYNSALALPLYYEISKEDQILVINELFNSIKSFIS
ncbi:MAG: DegT/DnrJ/EryC1/StrS family aminotransferase [Planctomycetota bacterium]|jgi:dTDP-4-amino-4,6-dideoxygalactose transaminase